MRRFTLITLIFLLVLLSAAAIYQLVIASRDRGALPGPVSGTPFPTAAISPTS
ncbi:MAG: hypothetical protein ACT4PO_14260 [Actinomycetota bacterium]